MSYSHMQTLASILIRDAKVFKKHIQSRFFDVCIWSSTLLIVFQYILPKFGVHQTFGVFNVFSNIAVWGLLEVNTNVATLVGDLHADQSISYFLTLPIPQTWIFIRIGLINAYKSMISTLPIIPLGKLVLWNHLILSDIAYGKLILSYLLINIFFGFFSLFVASYTKDLEMLTTIKARVIFPLWFLGGCNFTWYMLYETFPVFAYISLLNPIVYCMEGIRGCIDLGYQQISFHLCMLALVTNTFIFGYLGISKFKKRLDCL